MILSVVEIVDVGMWIKLTKCPKNHKAVMPGLQSDMAVVWTDPFFIRHALSTTFLLKIIHFKMYLVVCGNFSAFVYKEAESQEVAQTFTGSCSGLFWPEHSAA